MAQSKVIDFEFLARCIRGFPFPKTHVFKPEYIEKALDHCPQDGDIVLCSYLKTGSTWMQYIVWQIVHKGESLPELNEMYFKLTPMMETNDSDTYTHLKKPRIYKNHFPYDLLKQNPNAKYLYTYRNPADVLVSFYYFSNEIYDMTSDFDEYFEMFLKGDVAYGDFFDHFWSFYRKKDNQNLLLVSYEDLKKDPRSEYLRIAKFLGDEYYEDLAKDEELLEKILRMTSFDHMKNNLNFTLQMNNDEKKDIVYFRKGIVGDGKKTMTEQQLEKLQKKIKFRMAGTRFADLWCL